MKHQILTLSVKNRKKRFCIFSFFFIVGFLAVYGQKTNEVQNYDDITELFDKIVPKDSVKVKNRGDLVPFPIPITDENVGYGGVLGLAYMRKNTKSTRENTPRNITGIAGGGTNKGTWMVSAFHSRTFNNDKIRYSGILGYADVFLDFYIF